MELGVIQVLGPGFWDHWGVGVWGPGTPRTQGVGDREVLGLGTVTPGLWGTPRGWRLGLGDTKILGMGTVASDPRGPLKPWGPEDTWGSGMSSSWGAVTHLCSRGSLLSPRAGDECPQSLGVTWLRGSGDGGHCLWGHVRLGGVGHGRLRFPGSLLLPGAGGRCPLSLGAGRLRSSVAVGLRGFGDVRVPGSLLVPRAGDASSGSPRTLGLGLDPLWFCHLPGAGDNRPRRLGDTKPLLGFGDSRPPSLGDILGFGDPRLRPL